VLTVTVIEANPAAAGEAEGGLTVQVASAGAPAQAKLTVWLNPPRPLSASE
jgi:hypothetical protein